MYKNVNYESKNFIKIKIFPTFNTFLKFSIYEIIDMKNLLSTTVCNFNYLDIACREFRIYLVPSLPL